LCKPAQGISLPNYEIDINLGEIEYCFENSPGIYVGVNFRIKKANEQVGLNISFFLFLFLDPNF